VVDAIALADQQRLLLFLDRQGDPLSYRAWHGHSIGLQMQEAFIPAPPGNRHSPRYIMHATKRANWRGILALGGLVSPGCAALLHEHCPALMADHICVTKTGRDRMYMNSRRTISAERLGVYFTCSPIALLTRTRPGRHTPTGESRRYSDEIVVIIDVAKLWECGAEAYQSGAPSSTAPLSRWEFPTRVWR